MTSYRVMPFITDRIVYTIVNIFLAFCCPNVVPLIPVIFSREIRSQLMSLICWKDINQANYHDRNHA
uniref:Uncharacterized protein n=1 Tax=Romanomermis culicivorax TaxID=13658 RepID=A0A915JSB9_ROMCU